jgi:hypothetical protein
MFVSFAMGGIDEVVDYLDGWMQGLFAQLGADHKARHKATFVASICRAEISLTGRSLGRALFD